MKYRKKPIVVEAEQFLEGQPLPFRDRGAVVYYDGSVGMWYVETIHGQSTIVVYGDWIILESKGNGCQAYPCKPSIFEETYEAAE